MKYLKLAPVLLALSIGAWAQSDPKISSSLAPELNPNEVTVSRNVGNADKEFIGQTAYRVKIAMNDVSNELNRALFKAETSVVGAKLETVVPGQTAKFDDRIPTAAIAVSGRPPSCEIVPSEPNKSTLECDFGDGKLLIGDTAEFIILVQSPLAGGRIKLDWSFGGEEGKGIGNGCCTNVGTAYTTLIDDAAAPNSTVKTHAQTFVVKTTDANLTSLFTVFTGVDKGATLDDPWVTIADLGTSFTVAGNKDYVQALIDEKKNLDAGISSCSPSEAKQCWRSQLDIPLTTFPLSDPLWITVERHSSIIKNGTKLADYANGFLYSPSGAENTYKSVPYCASLSGGEPSTDPNDPNAFRQCLAPRGDATAACIERADPAKPSAFVWKCTFKATANGFIKR